MLTLNSLNCQYEGKILFDNLGFTLGDCCALQIKGGDKLARNLLLEYIAVKKKPDIGEILYANEQVYSGRHQKEYLSMIQYVDENNKLKDNLSVEENLRYFAGDIGYKFKFLRIFTKIKTKITNNPDINLLIPSALNFFKLEEYKDILIKDLSDIIKRRVELAKLLCKSGEIWLLNEPFKDLDEEGEILLSSLINTRCEQGGIVIIVSENFKINLENYLVIDLKDYTR